jgi:hypothetical protein
MQDVPGLWIIASLFGAVGVAMQVRWALTRTEALQAKSRGMIRAAIVEAIGLIVLIFSAKGQLLVYGLAILVGFGAMVGIVASRALRPPL